jgi:hypothetical protein
MYVATVDLSDGCLARVTAACDQAGIPCEQASGEDLAPRDDLLAGFFEGSGGRAPAEPGPVARLGALAVLLLRDADATAYLNAADRGFGLVLSAPPLPERIAGCLNYLCKTTPPRGTRQLWLDGTRLYSTLTRSCELGAGEAAAIGLLGHTPGRVVPRAELEAAAGADAAQTVGRLGDCLAELGSTASVLKIPHVGFRLTGSVHQGPPGTGR